MPVRTFSGEFIDIPLAQCFGKKCDDGRFHVILQNGTHGIWVSQEEREAEEERIKETRRKFFDYPPPRIIDL